MKTFKDIKKELLSDPQIAKEYKTLEPEYFFIKEVIRKRAQQGLSQKELAIRMGTKQSSIARFESGTYNPSIAFLKKIANALDTELHISLQ